METMSVRELAVNDLVLMLIIMHRHYIILQVLNTIWMQTGILLEYTILVKNSLLNFYQKNCSADLTLRIKDSKVWSGSNRRVAVKSPETQQFPGFQTNSFWLI